MKYQMKKDSIIDTNSKTVIKVKCKDNLKQYKKWLDSGTAFDGFTPSFFGISYQEKDN